MPDVQPPSVPAPPDMPRHPQQEITDLLAAALLRLRARHAAQPTVLTRVFDGVEHRVRVVGLRDFEYQGRRFKSLSAVARAIAGCPWSGPVFFGLKPGHKRKEAA